MTETLKKLMDDTAAAPEFDPVDIGAVIADGERGIRRRRTSVVGGAGLVAAALLVGGIALGDRWEGDDRVQDPAAPQSTAPVTWILDGVLHSSAGDVELGRTAVAYVRTGAGFVFVDETGGVYAIVDGEVDRIGTSRKPGEGEELALVADPTSTRATWVDPDRDQFVSHDLVTGAEEVFGSPSPTNRVIAADGDLVYVQGEAARAVFDLASGSRTSLDALLDDRGGIVGAGGGMVATTARPGAGDEVDAGGILVAPPGEDGIILDQVWSDIVVFSPDARYLSFDADEMDVRDLRTGEPVAPDMAGRPFASVYEWLDEDTVAAIASPADVADPELSAELITCEISTGDCVVAAADLGSFDDLLRGDFLLPTGTSLG